MGKLKVVEGWCSAKIGILCGDKRNLYPNLLQLLLENITNGCRNVESKKILFQYLTKAEILKDLVRVVV